MRKDERAALATLLDSVGLGYTKHQAETKLLRAYLQRTQPKVKSPANKAGACNNNRSRAK